MTKTLQVIQIPSNKHMQPDQGARCVFILAADALKKFSDQKTIDSWMHNVHSWVTSVRANEIEIKVPWSLYEPSRKLYRQYGRQQLLIIFK